MKVKCSTDEMIHLFEYYNEVCNIRDYEMVDNEYELTIGITECKNPYLKAERDLEKALKSTRNNFKKKMEKEKKNLKERYKKLRRDIVSSLEKKIISNREKSFFLNGKAIKLNDNPLDRSELCLKRNGKLTLINSRGKEYETEDKRLDFLIDLL